MQTLGIRIFDLLMDGVVHNSLSALGSVGSLHPCLKAGNSVVNVRGLDRVRVNLHFHRRKSLSLL